MIKRGKKYIDTATKVDKKLTYKLDDAFNTLPKTKYASFDESVDIAIRLGVDPRHADQMIRSSVVLPNGTGKTERVLVFATGDKVHEALDAGADYAGGGEYIEEIQGGWLEFDKVIATPDMMGTVGKIGRILGPRGMMPNAKLGTVTFDITRVVNEIKAGKVDFKVDRAGVVHAMIGKSSFGRESLKGNVLAFIDKIIQLKPSSSKGVYLRGVSVSSTMGHGIKLDTIELRALVKQA